MYFTLASGEFEPPCFICHLNVSPSDQNCSKTLTFILQPLILNQIRSDQTISSNVLTISIWGFEPPNFIFHLNVVSLDSNCATGPVV